MTLRWRGQGAGCAIAGAAALLLSACSSSHFASKIDPKYGVSPSPRVVADGQPIPRGGGTYKVGKPYVIAGRTYSPIANPEGFREEGVASWYGSDFHGRLTANGEVYDMASVSAAHRTLPIPSYARVTNLANRRSIVVRVNNRGPFHDDRIIDLSVRTAQALDFHKNGITRVRVEYIGPAPLEGSDDRMLLATLREDGRPAPAPTLVRVAAASPFIPESVRRPALAAGAVPLPPERPFDFGPSPAEDAAPGPVAAAATSPMIRPAATAAAFVGTAPLRPGFAAATGRGLY